MEDEFEDLKSIGAELVATADHWEKTPSEVVGELFAYIYEASRRMSTRAISAWLKENHGVEISQSTISRALRNPEKYWQLFAESIEPTARIVANALELDIEEVLFDHDVFAHFSHRFEEHPTLAGITEDDLAQDFNRSRAAIDTLRRCWLVLSPQTQSHCYKYLIVTDGSEIDGKEAGNGQS